MIVLGSHPLKWYTSFLWKIYSSSTDKVAIVSLKKSCRCPIRREEILFIDACNLGYLINRRTLELSDDDITQIAKTYHNWRGEKDGYDDVKGFCKSVTIKEVAQLDYVLILGRYVGIADVADDFDFSERFTALTTELKK